MRALICCLLFLLAGVALAEHTTNLSVTGQPRFEIPFASNGQLRLNIRSGDLKILGSDDDKVTVDYQGTHAQEIADVTVRFKASGNAGELNVSGGPHNNFTIQVHVPRNTGLYLRMPAGEVNLSGVTGDKDLSIHAGDLNISVGDPKDYREVDCSVSAGDLNAGPFGVTKDGLFRSFHQTGSGPYRLRVHAAAGDINLVQ